MEDIDADDRRVLAVLSEGRSNPLHIREQTDLGKGDVNTILVRLSRRGYVRQVTRGLYEITEEGEAELDE